MAPRGIWLVQLFDTCQFYWLYLHLQLPNYCLEKKDKTQEKHHTQCSTTYLQNHKKKGCVIYSFFFVSCSIHILQCRHKALVMNIWAKVENFTFLQREKQ